MNLIVLYKSGKMKLVPRKSMSKFDFNDKKIKMILVPSLDLEDIYIPVKPNRVMRFHHAKVHLKYALCMYAYETDYIESKNPTEFNMDCIDAVELINSLYNLYKMIGSCSIIEEEKLYFDYECALGVCPIRIKYVTYDEKNTPIDEVDSGELEIFSDPEQLYDTLLCYLADIRCEILSDIFYTVNYKKKDNRVLSEAEDLLDVISLREDNWKSISIRTKKLSRDSLLLIKMKEYTSYAITTAEAFEILDTTNKFDITVVSSWIDTNEIDPLDALDSGKIPMHTDKQRMLEAYDSEEFINIINAEIPIGEAYRYLELLLYINHLLTLSMYFGIVITEERVSNKQYSHHRAFIIFSNSYGRDILTLPEMTRENLTRYFIKYSQI